MGWLTGRRPAPRLRFQTARVKIFLALQEFDIAMWWIAVVAVWLLTAAGAGAEEPILTLAAAESVETVFSWAHDRCADGDIPDAPARAFRDRAGTVHLIAAHWVNRALAGPRLDAVRPDCRTLFEGNGDADPAAQDDRVWLAAFHIVDGETIVALGHMEYQGHRHAGRCSAASYWACWRNAVIQLRSTDGGRSFGAAGADGRAAVVASLPEPYDGGAGRPTGYFSPSNIVRLDDHLYAFVFAESYAAQARGACLLRTDRITDPTAWRAFDGQGFTVSLGVGRSTAASPGSGWRGCTPVQAPASTITSVARHRATDRFIALIAARRPLAPGEPAVSGIWYITSADLLTWSKPRLLFAAPLMFAYRCGDPEVFAYPSLLDPDSPSPNFESVGDRAWLYLTRFNMRTCKLPRDRDLVRIPLTITTR